MRKKGRETIYKIWDRDADFQEKMIELQHLNWGGFKILHIWLQKLRLVKAKWLASVLVTLEQNWHQK